MPLISSRLWELAQPNTDALVDDSYKPIIVKSGDVMGRLGENYELLTLAWNPTLMGLRPNPNAAGRSSWIL